MIETEIEARKRFDERVRHYEMGYFTIIEKTFIYPKTNPDVGEKFGHIKVISEAKKIIDEEFLIQRHIVAGKDTKLTISTPRIFNALKTSGIVNVQPMQRPIGDIWGIEWKYNPNIFGPVKKNETSGKLYDITAFIDTEASWNPNEFIWSTRYSKLQKEKTYAYYTPYIPLHIDDKPHDVINVKNAKKLGY
jgi:hypothetical protein